MLPKRYTDEKQYIMLMKMGSEEDNINWLNLSVNYLKKT